LLHPSTKRASRHQLADVGNSLPKMMRQRRIASAWSPCSRRHWDEQSHDCVNDTVSTQGYRDLSACRGGVIAPQEVAGSSPASSMREIDSVPLDELSRSPWSAAAG
jgi:hypothetical protein